MYEASEVGARGILVLAQMELFITLFLRFFAPLLSLFGGNITYSTIYVIR